METAFRSVLMLVCTQHVSDGFSPLDLRAEEAASTMVLYNGQGRELITLYRSPELMPPHRS